MTDAPLARAGRGRRRLGLRGAHGAGGSRTSTRPRRPSRRTRRQPGRAARSSSSPARTRRCSRRRAFAELLAYFSYDAFGALGLIEERSYAPTSSASRSSTERFSLADDALDPRGLPRRSTSRARPGARRARPGRRPPRRRLGPRERRARGRRAGDHGHAPPSSLRHWGPLAISLSVAGGEAESPEQLAELVGDGIYVTRLHYLSIVDPREGIVTGMTRDGTFRIRGGKIAEPLVNLRFTVSVPQLLAELPGLTREPVLINQNAYYDERYPTGLLSPAVATARFDVTGVGSGPGV